MIYKKRRTQSGGNNVENKHLIHKLERTFKSQDSCVKMLVLYMPLVWFSEISIKNILQRECVI